MAGLFSGCNLQQPSAGCQVQDATDAPWQALYTLKNPADADKSCGKLTGEAIGVFKYIDPCPDKDAPCPTQGQAVQPTRLAIRPAGAANLVSFVDKDKEEQLRVADPMSATSMSATLADEPNEQGLCGASGFIAAKVDARAVTVATDNAEEDLQAQSVSYAYADDVQVYSAPSAPGTQLKGTFRYSTGASGESCEYEMLALWPQTPCSMEAFENPTPENSASRCAEESGLNPDFDAVCVADIGPPLIKRDDDGNVISSTPRGGCVPNPKKGVPSFK
ncbi:hypothetical protein BON30_26235 [Cystobacter ferrugineus]|uniref:Lipoprotein MlpA n=1 Tax=Cystobacter ferrugineus TaxID=83449 RepID=A0A1L9B647_9BACT|nr:hypothetical protein BON30_26235 [Cystobacter ferrugineus]